MDEGGTYQIRVRGHLAGCWEDWFAGMTIQNEPDGNARLIGTVRDQAMLLGLLNQLQALNLTLLGVERVVQRGRD